MKRFMRKILTAVCCLLLLAAVTGTSVCAAGPIDTEASCSLTLTFEIGEEEAKEVSFRLYRVASVSAGGIFTVTPEFAAQKLDAALEAPDTAAYTAMATKLTGVVAADATLLPAAEAKTDANGVARFTGLQTGLYLVVGEIFHGFETFYTPQNFMVALPERLAGEVWGYSVSSEIKWEKRPDTDPVDLEVLKVWSDSSTNLHTADSVTVKLYKNGTLWDTQILNTANNWQHSWKQLYGGATWTLTEDAVEKYTTVIERQENRFVVTNTKVPDPAPIAPQTGLPLLALCGVLAAGGCCVAVGISRKKQSKQ